jgi:hypothetical protein
VLFLHSEPSENSNHPTQGTRCNPGTRQPQPGRRHGAAHLTLTMLMPSPLPQLTLRLMAAGAMIAESMATTGRPPRPRMATPQMADPLDDLFEWLGEWVEALRPLLARYLSPQQQQRLPPQEAITAAMVATALSVVGGCVLCLLRAPSLGRRSGKQLLADFEASECVQVLWLEPPDHVTEAAECDVGLQKLLQPKHIRLPNPGGCASRAIQQVSRHKEMLFEWSGTQTQAGNQVWYEFLWPTMQDAMAILDSTDALPGVVAGAEAERGAHGGAGDGAVGGSKSGGGEGGGQAAAPLSETSLRQLLCLLWALTVPCCEELGGDELWLVDNELHLKEEFEAFFLGMLRLLRAVLPEPAERLGLRDEDREVLWGMVKDYVLLLQEALEGDNCLAEAFGPDGRVGFELADEGSRWYVPGLEGVEAFCTELEDVDDAEDGPAGKQQQQQQQHELAAAAAAATEGQEQGEELAQRGPILAGGGRA